jgi:hypothetical protein
MSITLFRLSERNARLQVPRVNAKDWSFEYQGHFEQKIVIKTRIIFLYGERLGFLPEPHRIF